MLLALHSILQSHSNLPSITHRLLSQLPESTIHSQNESFLTQAGSDIIPWHLSRLVKYLTDAYAVKTSQNIVAGQIAFL
jgi:hypothetical protein